MSATTNQRTRTTTMSNTTTIDDILHPEVASLLQEQRETATRLRHYDNALTILDEHIARLQGIDALEVEDLDARHSDATM